MNNMGLYLLKVNLIILILYVSYRLLIHSRGSIQINRFLLLVLPSVGVLIPLISLNLFRVQIPAAPALADTFVEIEGVVGPESGTPRGLTVPWLQIVLISVYFTGFFLLLHRTVRQLAGLYLVKRRAEYRKQGKYTFIYTDRSSPFSFFYWIFIPKESSHRKDLIIKHEQVHARQGHSFDLLAIELFRIIFWYNPCMYWIRRDLRENHEFLADRQVIREHRDTRRYISELFAEAECRLIPKFSTPFRTNNLKKRIHMMLKQPSTKHCWFRYTFLTALIMALLVSFTRAPGNGSVPNLRPLAGGTVTLVFGFKGIHPVTKQDFTHTGIDIKAPLGTEVVAAGNGTVVEAAVKGNWGKLIIIRHTEAYQTYYAHLDDFSVEAGDPVTAGQVIGHVGTSGYSTGPHLHYEVRKDGKPVDPADYFD